MAYAWPMPCFTMPLRPLLEQRRCTAPRDFSSLRSAAATAPRSARLRRPSAGGFSGWGDLADGNTEGVPDAPKRPRRVDEAAPSRRADDGAPRRAAPREQYGGGRERSFSGRQTTRPGDWKCSCGGDNFASRTQCYRCGNDSPAPGRMLAVKREVQVRPGDWSCPECGVLVYASRSECFKCKVRVACAPAFVDCQLTQHPQAPRGESAAMEGGRPQDWPCPGCKFMNFASRTKCRQCGQAKS